jgi:hypothetical protein
MIAAKRLGDGELGRLWRWRAAEAGQRACRVEGSAIDLAHNSPHYPRLTGSLSLPDAKQPAPVMICLARPLLQ